MTTDTPRLLHLRRRALDVAAYRRGALESDCSTLITEPTLIYDDDVGTLTLAYVPVEEDTTALVAALRRIDIHWDTRTGGMLSRSRTFGSHPRNARRNNWCSPASLAHDDSEAHDLLAQFAVVAERAYARYNPTLAARHERLARAVRREWHLEDTAFTSGIVNRDNPLPYHYDTGNFSGVWSAMFGIKRDVRGGYLALPQYDLALEVADQTLTLFDGQGLLHGVTPFTKTSSHAYRFTVVYYSLEQMWRCLPPSEEAKRAHRVVDADP